MDCGLFHKPAALFEAPTAADLELVDLLVRSGADIKDPFMEDEHILEAVVVNDPLTLEVLGLLLDAGASAEEKALALQAAICYSPTEAARHLISSGADVNAAPVAFIEEVGYRSALQGAAERDNLDMVQFLLENGAEVERQSISENDQGTALQFAAIAGFIAVVYELIQRGANVNASIVGDDRRTASRSPSNKHLRTSSLY